MQKPVDQRTMLVSQCSGPGPLLRHCCHAVTHCRFVAARCQMIARWRHHRPTALRDQQTQTRSSALTDRRIAVPHHFARPADQT